MKFMTRRDDRKSFYNNSGIAYTDTVRVQITTERTAEK